MRLKIIIHNYNVFKISNQQRAQIIGVEALLENIIEIKRRYL